MADIIQFPLPATPNAGNHGAEGGAKTPSGSTLCDRSYCDIKSERRTPCNPLARFDFDTTIRPKLSKMIEHLGVVT
ncbi:MAG: hypothetical protein P1U50_00990 [Parvibaculaceae bacterium]|nr:hypothetical protein [Parvibaculaceae bacterium]